MKTFTLKSADIDHHWFVVDAEGQPLGRLASRVAQILRGKHKPTFTPHMNGGDCVIVVNAARIKLTGRKLEQKQYAEAETLLLHAGDWQRRVHRRGWQ